MSTKPNQRNWNDVQLVIVSIALVLTLVLWNNFAGPDRARAQDNSTVAAASATAPGVALVPTPLPEIKIIFGGNTPGTSSGPVAAVPPARKSRNGGGGSGGGGGGGGGTGGS